ncbi:hypothetical protein [Arenibacterium sp. LLYu02]|uniref:hypothetical protein n=1 Tax=Arenibacterium sp. LLYu02 TaxID=3404132 RepID=UPI003B2263B9
MSSKITVQRTAEGHVQVSKGTWSDTFPEERRLSWADWYEGMHKTYAYEGYQEMAKALRALPPS